MENLALIVEKFSSRTPIVPLFFVVWVVIMCFELGMDVAKAFVLIAEKNTVEIITITRQVHSFQLIKTTMMQRVVQQVKVFFKVSFVRVDIAVIVLNVSEEKKNKKKANNQ
jgi:hypothetical protein